MERNEKRIKYYLIYLIDNLTLYAYTDSKKLLKGFLKNRIKSKFAIKEAYLSSEDLKYLHEEETGKLLITYDFIVGEEFFTMVITEIEKLNTENYGNQAAFVDIISVANIPTRIFKKEMKEALTKIEYDKAYDYYNGSDESLYWTELFTPDLLSAFIRLYSDTLEVKI